MPEYPWFFDGSPDKPNERGLALMTYVQWLGSWLESYPYYEDYEPSFGRPAQTPRRRRPRHERANQPPRIDQAIAGDHHDHLRAGDPGPQLRWASPTSFASSS